MPGISVSWYQWKHEIPHSNIRKYFTGHWKSSTRKLESGITQAQLVLKELSSLDNCGNLVPRPPGLGKTMVACGLGVQAVNSGYTVCFEKMTSLIKILDTAETERAAGFRLKISRKPSLSSLMRLATLRSAADKRIVFHLSATPMKPVPSSLPPTKRSLTGQMMGDPVLTTAMLDRILHHAKVLLFPRGILPAEAPGLTRRGETGDVRICLPGNVKVLTLRCKDHPLPGM